MVAVMTGAVVTDPAGSCGVVLQPPPEAVQDDTLAAE